MATTRSTSISLRAARTPASGLVASSSTTISTGRPSTPPFALTSSATDFATVASAGPYGPPEPVSGTSTPMRIGPSVGVCARREPGGGQQGRAQQGGAAGDHAASPSCWMSGRPGTGGVCRGRRRWRQRVRCGPRRRPPSPRPVRRRRAPPARSAPPSGSPGRSGRDSRTRSSSSDAGSGASPAVGSSSSIGAATTSAPPPSPAPGAARPTASPLRPGAAARSCGKRVVRVVQPAGHAPAQAERAHAEVLLHTQRARRRCAPAARTPGRRRPRPAASDL